MEQPTIKMQEGNKDEQGKEKVTQKVVVADKVEDTDAHKGIIQTVKEKVYGLVSHHQGTEKDKDKVQSIGDIKPVDHPVSSLSSTSSTDISSNQPSQDKGIGQKIKESVTGTLDKMMHALSLSAEKAQEEIQVPQPQDVSKPIGTTTATTSTTTTTPTMEHSTTEQIGQKAHETKEQLSQLKDQAVNKAYESADYLKEKGVQAKDKISETYSQAKDKASGLFEQPKEKVSELDKDRVQIKLNDKAIPSLAASVPATTTTTSKDEFNKLASQAHQTKEQAKEKLGEQAQDKGQWLKDKGEQLKEQSKDREVNKDKTHTHSHASDALTKDLHAKAHANDPAVKPKQLEGKKDNITPSPA